MRPLKFRLVVARATSPSANAPWCTPRRAEARIHHYCSGIHQRQHISFLECLAENAVPKPGIPACGHHGKLFSSSILAAIRISSRRPLVQDPITIWLICFPAISWTGLTLSTVCGQATWGSQTCSVPDPDNLVINCICIRLHHFDRVDDLRFFFVNARFPCLPGRYRQLLRLPPTCY